MSALGTSERSLRSLNVNDTAAGLPQVLAIKSYGRIKASLTMGRHERQTMFPEAISGTSLQSGRISMDGPVGRRH